MCVNGGGGGGGGGGLIDSTFAVWHVALYGWTAVTGSHSSPQPI